MSVPAQTVLGPISLDEDSSRLPLMRWEDYAAITRKIERWPTLKQRPDLPADALFGLNLFVNGKNRSYAFVAGTDGAAMLYPDLDGEGRIDPERPWVLSESFDDRSVGTDDKAYLASFRWTNSEKGPVLEARTGQRRRGTVSVNGRIVDIELRGSNGVFTGGGSAMLVDLNRDGRFDDAALSDERFDLHVENTLSIEDVPLRFEVSPTGATVSWALIEGAYESRPSMQTAPLRPSSPMRTVRSLRHCEDPPSSSSSFLRAVPFARKQHRGCKRWRAACSRTRACTWSPSNNPTPAKGLPTLGNTARPGRPSWVRTVPPSHRCIESVPCRRT